MSEVAALFDGPRDGPLTVLTAVAAPSVEAELVAGFAEPGLGSGWCAAASISSSCWRQQR